MTVQLAETPFYFQAGAAALFGIFHEPATASRLPYVFCHPFAEEKLWAHRVFVSFARRLSAAGHPVLRFDCRGNGDSEGDFRETSVASTKQDVRFAIAEVLRRTGSTRVGLLGLRWGATIASLVAEEADNISELVLWAPIIDGHRYMQELLRSNLTTQLATYKEIRMDREALVASLENGNTVNVDGYEIGRHLYAEAGAIKLTRHRKKYSGRCLIVQVDRQNRPSPELQQLAATYHAASLVFAEEEPFWKEILRWYNAASNLFSATDQWLIGS